MLIGSVWQSTGYSILLCWVLEFSILTVVWDPYIDTVYTGSVTTPCRNSRLLIFGDMGWNLVWTTGFCSFARLQKILQPNFKCCLPKVYESGNKNWYWQDTLYTTWINFQTRLNLALWDDIHLKEHLVKKTTITSTHCTKDYWLYTCCYNSSLLQPNVGTLPPSLLDESKQLLTRKGWLNKHLLCIHVEFYFLYR